MVAWVPISFLATALPGKTLAFYRDVIGLELIEDGYVALVFADNGHMLRIQKVTEHVPPGHTLHGWAVTDIDAEVALLVNKGVEFNVFAQLEQAANGVWISPGGDKVAWFRDPAGNNLSLTEFGPGRQA